MKYLLIGLILFFFSSLFSHGGRLDSQNCHNDREVNNYHCHFPNKNTDEKVFLNNKKKLSEKIINEQWCEERNGIAEYKTKDGTYVDCITDIYAIEVEFDKNWKEAIGQSLHYAESTNKKAAILLIKKTKNQNKYIEQLIRVKKKYQLPIKVFLIELN